MHCVKKRAGRLLSASTIECVQLLGHNDVVSLDHLPACMYHMQAEQRQAEADLKERFEKLTLELKVCASISNDLVV